MWSRKFKSLTQQHCLLNRFLCNYSLILIKMNVFYTICAGSKTVLFKNRIITSRVEGIMGLLLGVCQVINSSNNSEVSHSNSKTGTTPIECKLQETKRVLILCSLVNSSNPYSRELITNCKNTTKSIV
jgi:hypothetical protein